MKKLLQSMLILTLVATCTALPLKAAEAGALDGKWSATVENEWGVKQTRILEIKEGKFTYEMKSAQGDTEIYAKGIVALKEMKPFKVAAFKDIQGGTDKYSLEPIYDDRIAVYMKSYSSLTLAMNFDSWRYDENPEAVTYSKVKE